MKPFFSTLVLLCLYHAVLGQAPSFKLNSAISVSPNPISRGSYVTVTVTVKNTGTTTGPFDFECDFNESNGTFIKPLGKLCNAGSGYTVPLNGTLVLTFNASSEDANPIPASTSPGNYLISIVASAIRTNCPACGTKLSSCVSSVAPNGFTLPYTLSVVACTNWSASTSIQASPAEGGSYNTTITATGTSCSFNTSFNDSWIVFDNYAANKVNYHVNANTGTARTGHIYINDVTDNINSVIAVTINQAAAAACNLSAPTTTAATNTTSSSFTANWQQVSGSNITYYVDMATNNTFSNIIGQQTVNSTSCNFVGLDPLTNYYYRVKYSDGSCTSGYSNTSSVQTLQYVSNQPPTATFNINGSNSIKANETVQFNGSASYPPITSWQWVFQGGTASSTSTQSPTVTYATPGTYRVTLTACNTNGCSAPYTQVGYINVKGSSSQLSMPPAKNGIGTTANYPMADPIQIGTGTYAYKHTDFRIPTVNDAIVFTRSYNSLNNSSDGSLGFGWAHAYQYFIDIQKDIASSTDTLWRVQYPDGHDALFVPLYNGGGISFPLYSGTQDSLKKNTGGDFTLFTKDNHRYNFNSAGTLQNIQDLNGNITTLNYTGNNLTSITGQGVRTLTLSYNGANKITSVTDPLNRINSFTYDTDGNLKTVKDPNNNITTFAYDVNHHITAVVNPLGDTVVNNTYDPSSKVISQKDAYNKITSIAYNTPSIRDATITNPDNSTMIIHHDSLFRRKFIQDELGFTKNYAYDDNSNENSFTNEISQTELRQFDKIGNLLTRQQPVNINLAISYNPYNSPTQVTDPNNNITKLTYDATNNPLSIQLPDNSGQNFVNNANGLRNSIKDGRGNVTSYTYSANGDLLAVTGTAGSKQYTYDAAGRLTKITDENSHATNIVYDDNDNIKNIADPLGNISYFTYDANNQLLSVKDKKGYTTSFTYDKKGRLLTKTNPRGGVTKYGYDVRDNLVSVIDPKNNTVTYTYDRKNRKTNTTNASGTTQYQYDGAGNLIRTIDPTNKTTDYQYTSTNKIQRVTDGLSNSSVFVYDKNDNLVSVTDALNRVTTYGYDAMNRLLSVVDADNKTTSITYDENGNKKEIKDPNTHAQKFTYDASNRLTNYQDAAGNNYTYAYDPAGNNISLTKPTGTITKTYDQGNRVLTVNNSSGNNYAFAYDNNGNMLSMTNNTGTVSMLYDSLNQLVQYTDPYNKQILFSYDKQGNKTMVTYPGNQVVKYTYDNANNLTTVTDWLNHTFTYVYDATGRITKLTYPNGITSNYGFDNAGRLISRNTKKGNTNTASSVFTLDQAGNRISEDRQGPIPTFLSPGSRAYTYGNDDRMTSDSIWSFGNDNSGNRVTETKGTKTATYTFSVDNLLTKLIDTSGTTYNYTYDALGHRLGRSDATTNTRYVLDISNGLSQVLQITDANGAIKSQYVYGLGLLERVDSANKVLYYHYDAQHNTIALSNDTAAIQDTYIYDPFGTLLSHTGNTKQPFTFLGEYGVEQEDSALYYVRARYYDAGRGRFLSKDSYPFVLSNPTTINRYVYGYNKPFSFFDCSGLYGQVDWNEFHQKFNYLLDNVDNRLDNITGDFGFYSLSTFFEGMAITDFPKLKSIGKGFGFLGDVGTGISLVNTFNKSRVGEIGIGQASLEYFVAVYPTVIGHALAPLGPEASITGEFVAEASIDAGKWLGQKFVKSKWGDQFTSWLAKVLY